MIKINLKDYSVFGDLYARLKGICFDKIVAMTMINY